MRWWIMEDALRDQHGHYREYISTFKNGFEKLGIEHRIFGSKEAEPWLCEELGVIPILPQSIWHRISQPTPKITKLYRLLKHGWATYLALNQVWKGYPDRPSWIFIPSVLPHHLLGWLLWLKQNQRKLGKTRILFFFPNPPVFVDSTGTPRLNPDPTAKLLKILLHQLQPLCETGQVVLGAETRPMVEALSEIFEQPFRYFPHPVEQHIMPLRESNQFLIGAYGGSRHEKGSDILQGGIKLYLQKNPDPPFHFAIQWVNDFKDENGYLISKDAELEAHPKVDYIYNYFSGDEYHKQLARTQAMLLPYRSSYQLRVSRVVIEAMLWGMPIITSRETTLFQQAEEHGQVYPIEQPLTPLAVCKALEAFEETYRNARSSALANASIAKDHFNVSQFLKLSDP